MAGLENNNPVDLLKSLDLLDSEIDKELINSTLEKINNVVDLGGFTILQERDKEFSDKFGDRYEKMKKLIDLGIEINPSKYDINTKSTYIKDNKSNLSKLSDNNLDNINNIRLAGRVLSIRDHGKIIFLNLQDSYGRIQIYIEKNNISELEKGIINLLDIGDFIGIEGYPFLTKREEPTIYTKELKFLGKSLRSLPDKYSGLKDKESIYRQPYLSTITNEESREKFILRSKVVSEIRKFMDDRGFLEIETPILGNTASGALASSFTTHHNALDIDLHLRIAPETNLKKAVVGGFEKVYEIGKQFRNEGTSPNHLQEFTSMEFYWSYVDKDKLMDFTKEIFIDILNKVKSSNVIIYQGQDIDFSGEWPRYTLRNLIYDNSGIDIDKSTTVEDILVEIIEKGVEIDIPKGVSRGNLIDLIYKKVARPSLINPCFVMDHPIDVSPLARRNDENINNTDRFQLVINGVEVVNAYGELVNAIDQRLRFEDQSKSRNDGDDEAHMMDEDYLKAMEYGMPPISGWGMGIDRLVAILTNQENLKDVVMFPLNRTEK